MENNKKEFGKLRSILFPIYITELRKFIPLASMFFLISINYTLLRSLKDLYIYQVTGAETIYYLKVFFVMPFIILLTIIYSKLSKTVSRDARFNIIIIYFCVFLGISYLYLMPHLKTFQLDGLAELLTEKSPKMAGLWEALRYWPVSLLYVNGEAWGTLVLSVLFWTFANEITPGSQAKRFYSFLSIGSSIGGILAGSILKFFKSEFNSMLGLAFLFASLLLVIYNIFSKDIHNNPALYQVEQKVKKQKIKTSFLESFKFLINSRYLALIAIMVLGYNMFISLFESVWKAEIKELVKVTGDNAISAGIYGDQGIYGGIITLILTFFFSAPIMNKGWRFAASFTPMVALICTVIFFLFLFFQNALGGLATIFHTTPLMMPVLVGLGNVVFIKSAKYIFFDPTKERAYIPLDEDLKIRGKAAVDGVGSRLGKSLGSVLITILIPLFGSIVKLRGYVCVLVILMLVIWILAVFNLSKLYNNLTGEDKKS